MMRDMPRKKPQNSGLTFRRVSNQAERDAAMAVRREVFVVEQRIAEAEEYDGLDDACLHYVALGDGRVVGTARIRFPSADCAKIERMAVLKPFRQRGIGAGILACVEMDLRAKGIAQAVLHAQTSAVPFYMACGYIAEGEHYYEAGIEHVTMRKNLTPD